MTLMLLTFFACGMQADPVLTPRERLIATRFEKKEALDSLYRDYGGGSAVGFVAEQNEAVLSEMDAEDGEAAEFVKGLADMVETTVAGADREVFDSDCLMVGQGHTVSFLTPKGKAFFEKASTVRQCRRVATLDAQIQDLERTISE